MRSQQQPHIVCLAGAHRSGTSMLARLLHAGGLALGSPSDLMAARPDNPDGFWEHLGFVTVNDKVLAKLGGAWDLPPPSTLVFDQAELAPLREEARSLIAGFSETRLWGWKDPRNSLTLPFWRELMPDLKVIAVVRNPLEVAYSMHVRNGTSVAFGLHLWETYNRRLLEFTGPDQRLITHYDLFFERPEEELRRIGFFARLPPRQIEGAAAMVSRQRRHTHFTIAETTEAGVSPEVVKLYQQLTEEAFTEGERNSPSFQATSPIQIGDLSKGATNQIDPLVPGVLARLRDNQLDLLQAHHDQLATQRDQLTGQLKNAESEKEKLRQRFQQTNSLLNERSMHLTAAEGRVVTLTQSLREQLKTTEKLFRFLKDTASAGDRLRKSRRWKFSNPVAWLKAGVSSASLPGFGHLDKVIDKFLRWREVHPEIENLEASIQELNPRALPGDAFTPISPVSLSPRLPLEKLHFATGDEIEVSIVIPVFNQFDFTHSCLSSLYQGDRSLSFEVIVVDDCSSDGSSTRLENIPGLVCLRNEENSGFIFSCNRGAAVARGDYLLFLNNDTTVTPGWLSALHKTFSHEPEAGLVGSKLIYPDGRLQEAGGIIWQDGSGWNRGKFQDPNKPEYNHLREVLYCSAASVMIPKALFLELGGFGSKYSPAYYEDTDLAFKVRRSGRKVLYQPLSVVIHHEGITSGTDTAAGVKKYQEVNRSTFTETWKDVLHGLPENGDLKGFYAPRPGKKRILVIDHHLPMPDRDSGSLRMFNILTILHQLGHQVTFIPDNLADLPPYGDRIRQRGIQFLHHPYITSIREYLQAEGPKFDFVILSRCDFARKHIAAVRLHAPQSRVIFDTVDLHFLREERGARLSQDAALTERARERRQLELYLVDEADETWVVSPVERDLLREERPDKDFEIVTNIVDVPGAKAPFAERRDILFIGSFQHPPNTDAVVYFVREIFPLVRERLGDVAFYIIGGHAPPEVIGLADENVIITGFQPEVATHFERIRLSVAPLRYGAGVKGKINQSMGFGVPVVASAIAVEGMELLAGEAVLVADDPVAFADAICTLYTSESLWESLSQTSLQITRDAFSREAATDRLKRIFSTERRPVEQLAGGNQFPAPTLKHDS
ncbi:MAG: glycosyltransferase [Chthoniobacterales bacterium]